MNMSGIIGKKAIGCAAGLITTKLLVVETENPVTVLYDEESQEAIRVNDEWLMTIARRFKSQGIPVMVACKGDLAAVIPPRIPDPLVLEMPPSIEPSILVCRNSENKRGKGKRRDYHVPKKTGSIRTKPRTSWGR